MEKRANYPWIVVKLSGEFLALNNPETTQGVAALAQDIMKLSGRYRCALVIGAGNILRGSSLSQSLGVSTSAAHYAGMAATLVNGIILSNLLTKAGCKNTLISALAIPSVAQDIGLPALAQISENESGVPIFVGGIGTPYLTTDTTAVIRGLQLGAHSVLKLTNVDGVFSADPHKNPHAKVISSLSYDEYLEKKLTIVDATAVVMARDSALPLIVAKHHMSAPISSIIDKIYSASIITDTHKDLL
jgi:uridylate kinase